MSLPAALREQAIACETLGSRFTARLMSVLADRLHRGTPLADRLHSWPGEPGPAGASLPLRLASGLHALVLSGAAPDLAAVYPPNEADDAALWQAVEAAMTAHGGFLEDWIERPPQTNEVGRSAVLIAVGHWLAARHRKPLVLSEIGASAGLNLFWDRYALEVHGRRLGPDDAVLTLTPDWSGPLPPDTAPRIAERRGVDLHPLDPRSAADRLRLLAHVWPDQPERMARMRAALDAAAPVVDESDAVAWLAQRLRPSGGALHLVFHTIAWQYMGAGAQQRCEAMIAAAGHGASDESPLAWFGMEADRQGPGAGLSIRLWPGGLRLDLGRADFHGRWIDWRAPDPSTGGPA